MFEDLMNQDNFSREELVMIYMLDILDEMSKMGIIIQHIPLTEKGRKIAKRLEPEPTDEEIIEAAKTLINERIVNISNTEIEILAELIS